MRTWGGGALQTKQMVYDLWELQGRYLKSGWFQADFVSVIPFDLLMVLDTFGFSESTRSRLRVLRLCKLLRLARVMAYVKMQVKDIRVDYNLLNLIMLTLLLMVFSHWMVRARGGRPPRSRTPAVCSFSPRLGFAGARG